LELTRKSDLALKAIRALHADGGRVKAGDLAEEIGTTAGFLNQALRPLITGGWITSEVGPRGGYALMASTGQLTVLELVEAIEGPVEDGRCVLQRATCPNPDPCALHDAWVRARDALLTVLAATRAVPTAAGAPPIDDVPVPGREEAMS
jgi:Rrf2 family transcriptional regulator, iron-sulfur cluster assembly transcription factor